MNIQMYVYTYIQEDKLENYEVFIKYLLQNFKLQNSLWILCCSWRA